jgi:glycosyltransferase involved in cell wall biosynthesis
MKLSVMIPSFQRPRLLAQALQHVAIQTRQPDEVIVVFDGDAPAAALEETRLPLRILATATQQGAAATRNLGARAARNDWLAFLDDDDWWLPNYLDTVSKTVRRTKANVICTSFLASVDGELIPEKDAPYDLVMADFFSHNPGVRFSNLVIRRSLYLDIGGCDEELPAFQDIDLGLRLLDRPDLRYARVDTRLVVCRKHSGPRLTGARSSAIVSAVAPFITRHAYRMTLAQRIAFAARLRRYWSVEVVSWTNIALRP